MPILRKKADKGNLIFACSIGHVRLTISIYIYLKKSYLVIILIRILSHQVGFHYKRNYSNFYRKKK